MAMSIPNWKQVETGIYSSGQPSPTDWSQLPAAGVRAVVNLRGPEEQPGFDEAKAVRASGLEYYEMPVRSLDDLSAERIAEFAGLVARLRADGVLVHCGSGNRVGAIFALSRAREGATAPEALDYGRRAGLTGLEPQIAALLGRR
jgi:uncharacterized protein (TIGR01244 family)